MEHLPFRDGSSGIYQSFVDEQVLKEAKESAEGDARFCSLIEALRALLRQERYFGLVRFCTDQIEPSPRSSLILCSAKFRDHFLWSKLPFGSLAAILDIAFDGHQEAKPLSNAERTQRLKARQLELMLRLPRPAQLTVTRQRANRYTRTETTGDTAEPTWERSHAIVALSQERSRAGFLWWFYLPNSLHQVTMNSFVSLQFWLGIGGSPANHLAQVIAHTFQRAFPGLFVARFLKKHPTPSPRHPGGWSQAVLDAATCAWEEGNPDIVQLWLKFFGPKIIASTESIAPPKTVVSRSTSTSAPAAALAERRRLAALKKSERAALKKSEKAARAKTHGSSSSSTSNDSSDESLEHTVDWCMQELTL